MRATRSPAGAGRRGRHPASGLLAAGLALAAGCSSAPAAGSAPAPRGLPAFYAVPGGWSGDAPGSLLKSERVTSSAIDGTTYRVMYTSRSATGKPVVVTGLVIVPRMPAPAGGYPIVTWGHGTNGMADSCAPSLDPTSIPSQANELLDRGWEVVASDYQGEGTPGILPYLVGNVAGQDTLDIVRAARKLPAAHASRQVMIWGHSEGGQTALFAWQLAPRYAPELHVVGVVAGAPPSQFTFMYAALSTSPYAFYLFMAAAGFHAAYGDRAAPLNEVLTPQAIALIPQLEDGCYGHDQKILGKLPLPSLVKADPAKVPAWARLMHENDPGSFRTVSRVPVLIIQGGNDGQIPVPSTQILMQQYCKIGATVQRWVYPGQSHAGVVPVSMPDMVRWMADRFAAGAPGPRGPRLAPDPYQPSAETGIDVSACPS